MTPKQWQTIRYFNPQEKWGDPEKMNYPLIQALERLRKYIDRPVIIHCGYDMRPEGWHPKGRAVDLHIEGLHPLEQFIAASRFNEFAGIGVYLWWHHPGLHLDNRFKPRWIERALWGSTAPKVYLPMDVDFMRIAARLGLGERLENSKKGKEP